MNNKPKKIMLAGGGTAGSVSPLLAIAEELQKNSADYALFLVGTKNGPEEHMAKSANIKFYKIRSGKLRRYFSWKNILDPIYILAGFFQSIIIIIKNKPDLFFSAGSFVSVPAGLAAFICRVPIIIHQQDARPTLSNKLLMPLAKKITTVFEKSQKEFGQKSVWTGNPIRADFLSGQNNNWLAEEYNFNQNNSLPIILIFGGGTGALGLNNLVYDSLDELSKFCRVIHITGKNKLLDIKNNPNYLGFEFLDASKMAEAMKQASIIISRAGMSALTEISMLGKPAIIIPMPDSHQEDNAKIFSEAKAAIVLSQKTLSASLFSENIKALLNNQTQLQELSFKAKKIIAQDANAKIIAIIKNILDTK